MGDLVKLDTSPLRSPERCVGAALDDMKDGKVHASHALIIFFDEDTGETQIRSSGCGMSDRLKAIGLLTLAIDELKPPLDVPHEA